MWVEMLPPWPRVWLWGEMLLEMAGVGARVGLVVDKFTITVGQAKLCPVLHWPGVGVINKLTT